MSLFQVAFLDIFNVWLTKNFKPVPEFLSPEFLSSSAQRIKVRELQSGAGTCPRGYRKMFSLSSPCLLGQLQYSPMVWGILIKYATKPLEQVAAPDCTYMYEIGSRKVEKLPKSRSHTCPVARVQFRGLERNEHGERAAISNIYFSLTELGKSCPPACPDLVYSSLRGRRRRRRASRTTICE